MNWLLAIREKFGLSQEWLSQYLNTSQTAIARAELNTRELPTHCMLLLQPFLAETPLPPLPQAIADRLNQNQIAANDSAANKAAKRRTEYQLKLTRLRKKLSDMQQKEQQALNSIWLAGSLTSAATDTYLTADSKAAAIEVLLSSAFVTLTANGADAQAEVQEKITMYEAVVKGL